MFLPGDEIDRQTAACIKVSDIFLSVRIDSYHDTFLVCLALKNALFVGKKNAAEVSAAEGLRLFPCRRKMTYPVTQLVPLRFLEAGTQGRVAVFLIPLCPPFASVIDTGNSRHAETHGIDQRKVLFFLQDGGDPAHIVIVDKGKQVISAVQGPWIGAELPDQGVDDLEQIHAVESRMNTFIALIIGG